MPDSEFTAGGSCCGRPSGPGRATGQEHSDDSDDIGASGRINGRLGPQRLSDNIGASDRTFGRIGPR